MQIARVILRENAQGIDRLKTSEKHRHMGKWNPTTSTVEFTGLKKQGNFKTMS